ncbi:FecR domain-containing protein [Chitinophaga rhizophila]|uniref:FecR domain-containing protein n=1 Tax=Chitinophaga rhizophila TaxID=2866212 RepID=A0ABS7GHS4_9BACT|nr:FecR domain-containing protein [Chitinophaga rhizophila]MBW8686324.1 FecR domain-containing protein [Chitinophaga rhizophila]
MELDRDHIHQLMNEKVMGVINATDEQLLQNALQEYPELQAEFEQLQQEYAIWAQQPSIQELNSEAAFAYIEDELQHRKSQKRKRLTISMLLVAATILALIIFIYPLTTTQQKHTPASPVLAKNTLQLKLSNGDVIDLSTRKDSITINNNTQLNNTNNALTYTAKDNATTTQQLNSLWVPPGMDYHITLSDGTIVFLNSATTLKFPFQFTGHSREITIHGEAYLQVAKDPNRPFILHTPQGAVQVLGTTFNVNSYDSGRVKVSLVDGAVSFATPEKQTLLKPGQALTYIQDKSTTLTALNENELLWIKGRYKLDNTPMTEITKVLPRWYGVQVVIDNPQTAAKRFTGTILKAEPIQEFLDAIKLTTGADSYYKDGILHIR